MRSESLPSMVHLYPLSVSPTMCHGFVTRTSMLLQAERDAPPRWYLQLNVRRQCVLIVYTHYGSPFPPETSRPLPWLGAMCCLAKCADNSRLTAASNRGSFEFVRGP